MVTLLVSVTWVTPGTPILVASGISHPPPPKAYAAGLGLLASLGEAPFPGRPIRLLPLPGQRRIYTSKRNFLILHQEERHLRWRLLAGDQAGAE